MEKGSDPKGSNKEAKNSFSSPFKIVDEIM
jgi:hypothetical protein